LLLISVAFPGDRFVMRTALAAVRKTATDDHEFVHRRFVEMRFIRELQIGTRYFRSN
jgi:hypothetical protein